MTAHALKSQPPTRDDEPSVRELVLAAENDGPQVVTLDGTERAYLVPLEVWNRMAKREPTMVEAIMALGPLDDLDIERR